MRRLAIVPARVGSKRLPGKNSRPLAGKALVNHTVEVARDCFDRVIVSSDAAEILALVEPVSNVEMHLRPPELSTDDSKVIDTVGYYYDVSAGGVYDQIWLCLPTCPLRTASDVAAGQRLLTPDVDGVVSITEYEFPPSLGLRMDREFLVGLAANHPLAAGHSRSQDQPAAYRPNGAFYGMWWGAFGQYRNFYRGLIKGYFMPRERSVDIDTGLDLALAELLLGRAGPSSVQEDSAAHDARRSP